MKHSICFLVFGVVFFLKATCQIFDNCGTIAPESDPFNAFPDSTKWIGKSGTVKIATIKIFTYIINQSGCQAYDAVSPQEVEIAIAKMEEQYNSISPYHSICFISIGNEMICNNDAYYFSNDNDDNDFDELVNCCSHIDAITIFFLPKDIPNFGGRASGIPGKSIVIDGNLIGGTFGVLAHEMGHCLGLFHTFHGSGCNVVFPNQMVCSGYCEELVNGINCNVCGDFLCDTPADFYGSQNYYSSSQGLCFYEGAEVDLNGDSYNPDISNIMSYGFPSCLNHFTVGQGERMFSFIFNDYSLSLKVVPQDIIVPMISLSDTYIPLISNYGVGGAHATNNTIVATNSIIAGGQSSPYTQSPQYGGVDNVNFIAGNSISLKHRFRAGGTFRASIENIACAPVFRIAGNLESNNSSPVVIPQFNYPISNSPISIDPNPSNNGVFQLSVIGQQYLPYGRQGELINVSVINVLGEVVFQKPNAECRTPLSIDISSQPKGIYFVKLVLSNAEGITNGSEMSVQKIVYQ